jgi:hypothetical protein
MSDSDIVSQLNGTVLDIVAANPNAGAQLNMFPQNETDNANQQWQGLRILHT